MQSKNISEELAKKILAEFDKGTQIIEILNIFGMKKGQLFKLLKANGRHRLDTGISNYKKQLETKAQLYWKTQLDKPEKESLIWLLEPEFGKENSQLVIRAYALIKTNTKLRKLLEKYHI